jgi:hypothetical protein
MIRSGASYVFSVGDNDSTPDETIEAILERSKAKAGELDTKLDKLTTDESSLRNFTVEATDSVYKFEGENYL